MCKLLLTGLVFSLGITLTVSASEIRVRRTTSYAADHSVRITTSYSADISVRETTSYSADVSVRGTKDLVIAAAACPQIRR